MNHPDVFCIAMLVKDDPLCYVASNRAEEAFQTLPERPERLTFITHPEECQPPSVIQAWWDDLLDELHEATVEEASIVLVTWHPGVISLFGGKEGRQENVYVWNGTSMLKLTDLHSLDWLAHYDIGDLYWRGDFGETEEAK